MKYEINNLALICDDNYALPTAVMLQSIKDIANKYGNKYRAHIVSWKLKEDNISLLKSLGNDFLDIEVHIVDVKLYQDRIKKINQNSHVTPTSLLKFELADIVQGVDTLLYLDSDMIVKGDLTSLFYIDLKDCLVAASFDFGKYLAKLYEFTGDDSVPEFYFNSGVMLLNLKLFREENLNEKLWESKLKKHNINKNGKFGLMDQDAFNDACKGRVLPLAIKYNCNCLFTHDVNEKLINKVYSTTYTDVLQIEKDAVIIHYVGTYDKPWKYDNIACQKYWDTCYQKMGGNISELNRTSIRHDINYYIKRTRKSLDDRGFFNTIKYIWVKVTKRV